MSEKKPTDQRISAVPPFGLRMLPDLRTRLEEACAQSGRSLNAEIIHRLNASFEMDDYVPKVNAHEDKTELVINSLSHRERALVSAIVEAIRSPNKD